jgi:hypothetical protein
MGGGEVEMGIGDFVMKMGMIHLVVVRILVVEWEDPPVARTSIAATIATLICFSELEMEILGEKGVLEVEIIRLVVEIISPTGAVIEMMEIIPLEI